MNRAAARPPATSRIGRLLAALVKTGAVLLLLVLLALGVAVAVAMGSLPSYSELVRREGLGQTIRFRAANGTVLMEQGPSFGQWLRYDEIPPQMRAAMIAVEDHRFRSHIGMDPIGVGRALAVRVRRGTWTQGASTITQQLARNIFLTNTRTFGRKLKEGVLALALERKFSKDQILELYLNRVYFGGGAYGIDAASRKFFGHSARNLSLGEAAIIAGLVKAPSNYSPTADAEAARERSAIVLEQMVKHDFLSPAAAASVDPARVRLEPTAKQNSVRYFTDWALPQLDLLIDERSEPIDVWTTLDPRMQAAADAAIRANVPGRAQGALVAIDRDGAVRAMIGGRDYVDSLYNRATQAQRQPGSAFKLFVYLAALEAGMKPTDTMVDEPIEVAGWRPRNASRSFAGEVTLREAFARSLNTISAKIGAQVGFPTIADMAHRFGISSDIATYPSMVLGTSDVRLIDMTRAFAAVAARGHSVTPYPIIRVVTADGRLLYRHDRDEQRVLVAPWVAAQMTDLLQSAVLSGTGRAAQLGRPVAGKTGTTSSNRDGWFIGFSSGLTTGVWMGRDDARPVPGLQGGTAPARAFRDFMVKAVAPRPVENFEIEVPMPDWQLEPDEEAWGMLPEENAAAAVVDEFGNPLPPAPPADPLAPGAEPDRPRPSQTELDRIFATPPPPPSAPPPVPRSVPPANQMERPAEPAE